MNPVRRHMLAKLQPLQAAAPVQGLRAPSAADVRALAALMMDAYAGTIDHDEGETEEDALGEVQATLSGANGPYLESASRLVEIDGRLASATLVIRWRGLPFVAFTMTAAACKRRGLARACLVSVMRALHDAGEMQLRLLVTVDNIAAVALYRSLGFDFEPSA